MNAGAGNDTVVLTAVFSQVQVGRFEGGEGVDTLDVTALSAGFSSFSNQGPTFAGSSGSWAPHSATTSSCPRARWRCSCSATAEATA